MWSVTRRFKISAAIDALDNKRGGHSEEGRSVYMSWRESKSAPHACLFSVIKKMPSGGVWRIKTKKSIYIYILIS